MKIMPMIIFSLLSQFQMSRRQNPSEFLKQIIGKPVVVKLNSGVDYRGIYFLDCDESLKFFWVKVFEKNHIIYKPYCRQKTLMEQWKK